MARKGLGKGLASLIPNFERVDALRVAEIEVSKIVPNPRQPRKEFDPELLNELISSIAAVGVIQPVIVRKAGEVYELIAGERRWRAAVAAGLETIPAIIRQASELESLQMSLIENLNRDDLNFLEQAYAYQQLIDDFGLSHAELAEKLGKSRSHITNVLRLLNLDPEVQMLLAKDQITYGHARALLSIEDKGAQRRVARKIAEYGLSVRQTERLVRRLEGEEQLKPRRQMLQPTKFPDVCRQLSDYLSVPVRIIMGKKKGRIEIEFGSLDDLERIFGLIVRP